MKLDKDARIFTVGGEDIGNLNRFVLDPRTKKVTHIVFEHGLLTKTEYLVPMELVDRIDETGIHLRELPVDSFIELQRFEETDYVITDEHAFLESGYASDNPTGAYYYYPSAPLLGMGGPTVIPPSNNPRVQSPVGYNDAGNVPLRMSDPGAEPPVRKEIEENIPEGTVALKEGAKVISSDGKHIGDIERLVMNPQGKQATHLLVTKGLLTKEKKLLPIDWVDQLGEEEVHLVVDAPLIDRLPRYERD